MTTELEEQEPPEPVYYYRYYDVKPYEGWKDLGVRLEKLRVTRETEHCVWLDVYCKDKRVYKNATRSYAYATIELAQNSYKIRKQKQLWHVQERYERCRAINEALKVGTAFEQLKPLDNSSLFNQDWDNL